MAEKAQARGGLRKAAFWTCLGCLALPIGLVVFIAISLLVGYTFYDHEGPPEHERSLLTVPSDPVGDSGPQPAVDAAKGAGEAIVPGKDIEDLQVARSGRREPIRLRIDLEEGEFEIRPGPPGTDIQVEGFFDPRDYELTQETEDGDEGKEVSIRFHRKVPFFFHLFRGGFTEDGRREMNKVIVRIPEDLPTALELRLSKGESETDLGGMTLTSLEAHLRMGDHDLTVSRPLQGEIERAEFHTAMGEMELSRLGNVRARRISFHGKMGELKADLGGEWPRGFTSRADLTFSMGECRIDVPAGIRISPDSTASMFLGESEDDVLREGGTPDPDAPTVEIHTSARLGEVRINRY